MNQYNETENLIDEIYPANHVSIISDTSPMAKVTNEVMAPLFRGEPSINPTGYHIQSGAMNLEIMEKALSHPGTIILNITTADDLIRIIAAYESIKEAGYMNPDLNPLAIIINKSHLTQRGVLDERIRTCHLIPFTSENTDLFTFVLLSKIKADQEKISKHLAEPPKRNEMSEDETFEHMQLLGIINIDHITLDLIQSEIKMPHHTEAVHLTPTEVGIMVYFLRNRQKLLTYDALSIALNGAVTLTSKNHINQVLFRLRKKIEPNSKTHAHLITVKGHGVRFITEP